MPSPKLSSTIHLYSSQASAKRTTYLVFFITGNPGLIEYYRPFLIHLYGLLSNSQGNQADRIDFQVFGRSLCGFGTTDAQNGTGIGHVPPYGLQEQIEIGEQALRALVHAQKRRSGDVRVILIGHSVGSYILLELIRRLRSGSAANTAERVNVVGGICLFPTVVDIAKSQSGRRAAWLLHRPSFAMAASLVAKCLLFFVPLGVLSYIIGKVMAFPAHAALTTAAFAKSTLGIRQALYLAGQEMDQITADAWDSEIWGAAHPSSSGEPHAVLRFLFAARDHWVADETRDELIRSRGRNTDVEEWKPKMEIDGDQGWPHGFCIKHSIPVAQRVKEYIDEILQVDSERLGNQVAN